MSETGIGVQICHPHGSAEAAASVCAHQKWGFPHASGLPLLQSKIDIVECIRQVV
jgi:hypothetical protein